MYVKKDNEMITQHINLKEDETNSVGDNKNPQPIVAFLEVILISHVKPAISGRKYRQSCQDTLHL